MKEIWKDIKGYEGFYKVSNKGFVKSLRSNKILKNVVYKSGYCYVGLCVNGTQKNKSLHRIVAETFITNHKNKPQVNHKDGNKLNNCTDNLEWCTASENIMHASENGLGFRGSLNGRSILKESDVIKIRKLRGKKSYRKIGEEFGISKSTIYNIMNNLQWVYS